MEVPLDVILWYLSGTHLFLMFYLIYNRIKDGYLYSHDYNLIILFMLGLAWPITLCAAIIMGYVKLLIIGTDNIVNFTDVFLRKIQRASAS